MELTSAAFKNGATIPQRYTRDGDNVSPPLAWRHAPNAAKSFALVVEDPDAPSGTFRHWAVSGIDRKRTELPEGAGRGVGSAAFRQAVNDFGDAWYDGPEPPRGDAPHHYRFRLAALDIDSPALPADAGAAELWDAVRPHIIEEAELVGVYGRG